MSARNRDRIEALADALVMLATGHPGVCECDTCSPMWNAILSAVRSAGRPADERLADALSDLFASPRVRVIGMGPHGVTGAIIELDLTAAPSGNGSAGRDVTISGRVPLDFEP